MLLEAAWTSEWREGLPLMAEEYFCCPKMNAYHAASNEIRVEHLFRQRGALDRH
jgi:hypothetical protein